MPEPHTGSSSKLVPSSLFSLELLTAFVERGVQNVVLSPGSRSQALALVAAELERVGAIRLHVRIDERVAGFLALGLAIESRTPVVIITTSGTATANLHPAVLEAHHARVPLILLTADRPVELRGIRSNQTTTQPSLYGAAARLSLDVPAPVPDPAANPGENEQVARLADQAVDVCTGRFTQDPGPVQLNLSFREPLSSPVGDLSQWWHWAQDLVGNAAQTVVASQVGQVGQVGQVAQTGRASLADDAASLADQGSGHPGQRPTAAPAIIDPAPGTIVVAGADAGARAEAFARAGGWPLIAEVTSGSRFGPNLVVAYRELLTDPDFGGRVRRVVIFGHPTLSREVPQLITSVGVESIVVAPAGVEFYNPGHAVSRFERAVIAGEPKPDAESRAWLGSWVFASRRILDASIAEVEPAAPDVAASHATSAADRAAFARTELAVMREPINRCMLVDALWRITWPHDRLIFGASRLIREADKLVPGKRIRVHSNRGLAGIDGTIATGIGIALASEANAGGGVTRVLLGDLALLHDAGALLFGLGERMPRIQVIVGNDGGGTIFDSLEVAATAPHDAMDRVLLTPQRVDLAALAAAYGWEYARAGTRNELERALTAPTPGPMLVEVPLER